jgi:Flp pilus assembly protein TadD
MRPKVLLSLAPLLGYSRKALDVWAEALTYDQHNPKIWEEISIALAHLGHLQLAVQAADRALGLRPTDVGLHERLAVLLAALEVGIFLFYAVSYPLFVETPL